MEQKFLELMKEVFDENNTIKACGREKCQELINLADHLEPNVFHGDVTSGFVNADTVTALRDMLEYKS